MTLARVYGNAIKNAFLKKINFDTDTMMCMLCTSSFTPNQDTDDYKDDITNEVSASGYDAGGKEITNTTVSYDGGSNTITFDGDSLTWANSTITARYAIIYDDTPSGASNKPLIGYIDFEENKISDAGPFEIDWSSDGILTAVVAG